MMFWVDRTGVRELQGGAQFRKAEFHHRRGIAASMRTVCVGKSIRKDNANEISKT
jgi:hypothetical protein